ncbi:hypothetical protein PSTG_11117 [Puccinia striiformis f. sp. tritici PST-78]|uniref:Uncharacterized protein n=1 Tax=Puccinia striiformis f. sp. tritici PST-78 TaxID=1165861 RepID=A0A0L0V8L4_9BASI|nr:hypothetical protein PSTG_11117 [Puccinia striiformis f. sp. tritici PST-78]
MSWSSTAHQAAFPMELLQFATVWEFFQPPLGSPCMTLPKLTAPDLAVRQEVGHACPSRWSGLSTAPTAQSEHLLDGHVRELLGQAGPRTRRTGRSEQSVSAV